MYTYEYGITWFEGNMPQTEVFPTFTKALDAGQSLVKARPELEVKVVIIQINKTVISEQVL